MDKQYVYRDEHGRYCVGGPRMFLDLIVEDFKYGESPESIRSNYPFLSLEQVYGAITFYLAHQQEVDEYMRQQDELGEQLRKEIEAIPSPVVERLRNMRQAQSTSQPFALAMRDSFMRFIPFFALAAGGLFASSARAQSADPTYWQDIRPILRKHCTVCHSARNLKEIDVSGGLALDTFAAIRKGSAHPILKAGAAKESLLHKVLVTNDPDKRMPLDAKPLPEADIALIRKWIDTGAKEGKDPGGTEPVPVKKLAKLRKLDVLFPTNAIPPAPLLPKNKPGKLELVLKVGPLAPITALAFSPDGRTLAVGSHGQVAIWDLENAKVVRVLTNVLGAVNDFAFSPKGDLLAVSGGQPSAKGDLRLYETRDWKLVATVRGHDDVIFSVDFSPDGSKLASASFDHKVKVWDVKTQTELHTFTGHSDFVYAVAFSPDGTKLASASKDRTVQLFNLASGRSRFTYSGLNEDVLAVAFHPDGKSIVSSGFETALYWWNAETGEKIKTQGGHGVAVHELAFSKDGKRLVSAGADRTARVWDGNTGAPLKTIPVGSVVYSVAINGKNTIVASGSFDGVVRLWDEATGRHLATLFSAAGEGDEFDWLAVAPEGYAVGSERLVSLGRWRMLGAEVDAVPLWKALRQPERMAQALRGEAVSAAFDAMKK